MSELDELQSVIKSQGKSIDALIRVQANNERATSETNSTSKKLAKVQEELKTAETALAAVKDEGNRHYAEVNAQADALLRDAESKKTEAVKVYEDAASAKRRAEAQLGEANDLYAKHQAALADVQAQKDKILKAVGA